jgi:murein L,D-transpeptidase YcbB/YkuD
MHWRKMQKKIKTKKNKKAMFTKKIFNILSVICCFVTLSCQHQPITMEITSTDTLVQKFYKANQKELFWFNSNQNSRKAAEWLTEIEAAQRFGIVSDQAQIDLIKSTLHKKSWINNLLKDHTDQQVTGLILHYLKELQEGNTRFDYDEVRVERDSVYIKQLINTKRKGPVNELVTRLDCKDQEYQTLKRYLNDSITREDTLKFKSVIVAMNYRRYLSLNYQSDRIVINIPEAVLRYYKNDAFNMEMRAVAGKKKTPTPTIASNLTTVVTFPFWNVPHSIAVTEILPKVQKDEIYLERNNLYVVNGMGITVEDSELNWNDYTAKNFPYYFRQSTGAKNALGVLKFDLQNPFSIYLHSTSSQSVFSKEYRFLSHGCIRLEKPIDLAENLLGGKLDVEELKKGMKDTESEMIELPKKVPVFIIYSPAFVSGNSVTFLPDVYGLIK